MAPNYVTLTQFQEDFPAFANCNAGEFAFWQNMASLLLRTDRLGQPAGGGATASPYDMLMELFIAHNLTLDQQANGAAANGAPAGISTGPVASKTVGGVSVNYDTTAGIEVNGGHWNLTTWGTRFLRTLKMFGAGPMQSGATGALAGGLGVQCGVPGAYSGPYDSSGFF